MVRLVFCCITVSLVANAQSKQPNIYQVPLRAVGATVSPLVPQRLNDQLRRELARSQDINLQPDLNLTQKADADASARASRDRQRVDEGRALLGKGRQLLKRKEYSAALSALEGSVSAFESGMAELNNFGDFLQALSLLGVAQILKGKDEEGDRTFQRLATLKEGYEPDVAAYQDPVEIIWNSARRRVKRRKDGAARVTTDPSGATVYIDGRRVGVSPVTAGKLKPGQHIVVVRAPDRQSLSATVKVSSQEEAASHLASGKEEVAPQGGPSVLRVAYHGEIVKRLGEGVVDTRIKRVAKGFSKAVDSNYLVMGHVERQPKNYTLRAYVYEMDTNRLAEVDSVIFDADLLNLQVGVHSLGVRILEAIRDFPADRDITTVVVSRGATPTVDEGEASGLTGEISVVEVKGPADVAHIDANPRFYRRWWFLTAVGVVAVGAAGFGIYKITQGKSDGTITPVVRLE